MSSNTFSGTPPAMNFNPLLTDYSTMSAAIQKMMNSLGQMSAGSINVAMMMQLQLMTNTLTTIGSTISNMSQGLQNLIQSSVTHLKGS
jgi:hypothetical protein